MKKYLVVVLAVVVLLAVSVTGLAAKRFVLIDPAHGGLNYGFEVDGRTEKELNLKTAYTLAQYLEKYAMTRTGDQDNQDGPAKTAKVNSINPDIILGIHHHGKYSAFIEFNPAGRQIAFQLAAYFASEDIPFKLVPYKAPWLFPQPQPALVIIINDEIEAQTDFSMIAKILEGLE